MEKKISLNINMQWKRMETNISDFHTFFIVAHFDIVFILTAVNEAAFDQTQKIIKEKSSSQRSIQINKVGKIMEVTTRLRIF